jgi:hypothetical protein
MRLFYSWIIYKKINRDEKPVILVTYNMSFASNKGMSVNENTNLNYPSEMSFLHLFTFQTPNKKH